MSIAEMLKALYSATGEVFHYSDSPAKVKTIQVFTRFAQQFIRPVEESNRHSIRHLAPPAKTDLLLAIVHSPSKLHWSEDSQVQECGVLAQMVESAERKIGHFRTVLVGDLNMNRWNDGTQRHDGSRPSPEGIENSARAEVQSIFRIALDRCHSRESVNYLTKSARLDRPGGPSHCCGRGSVSVPTAVTPVVKTL